MAAGSIHSEDEVLVLGGGVIGLACAQALAERGHAVRVLERDRIGAATSHGNCGTLTPSHALPLAAPGMVATALRWMLAPDAPFHVKPRFDPALAYWLLRFAARCTAGTFERAAAPKAALLLHSQARLADLVARRGLDCDHTVSGLMHVFRDPAAFAAKCAHNGLLESLGIEVEVLDGRQLEASEPALKPGLAGALHYPGDAQLRPERFCAELARVACADGAVIEEGAEALDLRSAGGVWTVQLADGSRRTARQLLVATGPWAARLLGKVGLRAPIQPGKGYSITYPRPALVPRRPLVLKEHAVCITAWDDGLRLGSTMEFVGYDRSLNRVRLDALERAAGDFLQHPIGSRKLEEWYGWRPMTWDDLPLLGPVPGKPGLWVAAGHGMMGVSMAAGSAALLAESLAGESPSIDIEPYRVDRF